MTILEEKAHEFQQPLCICALDFQKAFDSVSHDGLWHALLDQGVPALYVSLIANIYNGSNAQGQRSGNDEDI